MDWLSSQLKTGLAEAQKKAAEAAEKARVLAAQASEQARALAEKATEEANKRLQTHASGGSAAGPHASSQLSQPAKEELATFGVTPALLECIGGMSYSLFSDMKSETWAEAQPVVDIPRLTQWQERHAMLVLGQAPHLQGLRFALSPRHMTDEQFWYIYFKLVADLLPAAEDRVVPAAQGTAAGGTPGGTPAEMATAAARSAGLAASRVLGSIFKGTQGLLAGGAAGGRDKTAAVGSPATTAALGPAPPPPGDAWTAARSPSGLASANAAAADRQGAEYSPVLGAGSEPRAAVGAHSSAEGHSASPSEHLADLEDDPELAAYLQEALAVDERDADGGDGSEGGDGAAGGSDLGSAAEDLDDYINQLDAELGGSGESAASSSRKEGSVKEE